MRVVAMVALALLAGCGRVGPIAPPGPAERITYPRFYPAQDPGRPAPAAPVAPPADLWAPGQRAIPTPQV